MPTTIVLPEPFASIPREELMFPHFAPISPLPRFSAALLNSQSQDTSTTPPDAPPPPSVFIKREDVNSPLAFGGNKIRKLEYVLPDALAQGATVLVTTGGQQSNHMRQVAAVGARYGLETHLVPRSAVKPTAPDHYNTLGNIQLTRLLGATHVEVDTPSEKVLSTLSAKGEKPYWIPSGASTHPLGGLGFARFAFEIAAQETELDTFFSTIIVPSASGSTLGGIVAGFKLLEKSNNQVRQRRVIGVDCFAAESGTLAAGILKIAKTTASKIGLSEADVAEQDVMVDERWNAEFYGKVDEATDAAIKLLARTEGILTDPVYTGKALAGLIGMARLGEFQPGENVLFIHTGGVQVLSAYPDVV